MRYVLDIHTHYDNQKNKIKINVSLQKKRLISQHLQNINFHIFIHCPFYMSLALSKFTLCPSLMYVGQSQFFFSGYQYFQTLCELSDVSQPFLCRNTPNTKKRKVNMNIPPHDLAASNQYGIHIRSFFGSESIL